MVDTPEQFEVVDIEGTTIVYSNTVGTSEVVISNSGKYLQNIIITSANKTDSTKNLQFRFSATDAWFSLGNNCVVGWTPKETTEIRVMGATAATAYEIIANWENDS